MAEEQDKLPGEQEEVDYVFQVQMAGFRAVQNYWKHVAAVAGAVLLVALFYGLYDSNKTKDLKAGAQAIADVDRKMPQDPMAQFGMVLPDDPGDEEKMAQLTEGAKRYEEAAKGTMSGTAGEAWLKAADSWLRVGETDKAKNAYLQAAGAQPKGVIGFGARNALASLELEAGNADAATALYRESADTNTGFLAEDSLLALARVYDSQSKDAELKAVFDEFRLRFPDSARVTDFAVYGLEATPAPAETPVEVPAPEGAEG